MPRRGWARPWWHRTSSWSVPVTPPTATWRPISRWCSPRRSRPSLARWPSGSSRRSSFPRAWSARSTSPGRASSTFSSPKPSVQARIGARHGRPAAVPEGRYHGEYIRDIAERYLAAHPTDPEGADLDQVRRFAVQELRKEQDADLQALGVRFDVYFLESSLYTTSKVERTMGRLVAAGHTYEKDGALWQDHRLR